ncbi:TetR/AcrR family transcriptional regulator [Paenibacillus sp. SYP-B3998]|uniref:TetR/AcrR family transcriptional regulator n=1 Tax=Paenibacillus sp. SYP-B3998 TaxID=2678564 RepID=A0A6G3ZWP4_9BACL|nr:TetR/AcrR family transcriptional regulator [Paenibacillus sp. SYP-B3998]NEW05837.1 TetR/AcrR family transcriptional regulator [Paenibacillus sp. SYP-B3998]
MPYTKTHKMEVRRKILKSATQAFRISGIKEVSVPQIMKGAGLTHGGFYAHFESKDQLVAEACRNAIEETITLLRNSADKSPENEKIQTVIEHYLSTVHRDKLEESCIIPTLSVEISRSSGEVRQVFTEEITRFFSFISGLLGNNDQKSMALISTMIGSLLLARSVNDPELSAKILTASKSYVKELVSV